MTTSPRYHLRAHSVDSEGNKTNGEHLYPSLSALRNEILSLLMSIEKDPTLKDHVVVLTIDGAKKEQP